MGSNSVVSVVQAERVLDSSNERFRNSVHLVSISFTRLYTVLRTVTCQMSRSSSPFGSLTSQTAKKFPRKSRQNRAKWPRRLPCAEFRNTLLWPFRNFANFAMTRASRVARFSARRPESPEKPTLFGTGSVGRAHKSGPHVPNANFCRHF